VFQNSPFPDGQLQEDVRKIEIIRFPVYSTYLETEVSAAILAAADLKLMMNC